MSLTAVLRKLCDLPASSSARALILVVRRWYVELRICRVAKGSLQWASYPALTCVPHAVSWTAVFSATYCQTLSCRAETQVHW